MNDEFPIELNPFYVKTEDNRDMRIKQMFYGWDENMTVIREMQKCQRNWDYSKKVHPEIVDYLLWIAREAPSKQHEAYYDVYYSTDRETIQEMSRYTWGSTHTRTPPSTWRNTQANANMYMLFVAKEPETQLNCNSDGTLKPNNKAERWENAYVSIGIAMGLVMQAANKMGLQTGCNKSHDDVSGNDYWIKKLGIEEEVKAGTKKIAYGIGIGFANKGRPRYETDDTELALGAGNGGRITTDPDVLKHPRLGKELRMTKIVDIREFGGRQVMDYHGDVHDIPTVSEIKVNSIRQKIINTIEIK